jgi:SAM-dependent methyltransferase
MRSARFKPSLSQAQFLAAGGGNCYVRRGRTAVQPRAVGGFAGDDGPNWAARRGTGAFHTFGALRTSSIRKAFIFPLGCGYMQADMIGFNEQAYLAANPDVAAAVRSGACASGAEHYTAYGRNENRPLRRPANPDNPVQPPETNDAGDRDRAGKYWDQQLIKKLPERIRWWEDRTTLEHINRIVEGRATDGMHAGFHNRILKFFPDKPAERAISVGCGVGTKEWELLRIGAVKHFDLYDISEANILHGRKHAEINGFADRVTYRYADVFEVETESDYDLVYWNNSLHHMSDVYQALRFSHDRLRFSGLLAIDDYVGPTRFQWTEENLRWARLIRHNLPDRLLKNPWAPGHMVPRQIMPQTPDEIVAIDPSEAMDSGRILSALYEVFPSVEIIPTGGALYHLALSDIYCNFVTEDDNVLLRQILMLDQLLAENGTTQYAVAFASK